MPLDWLVGLFAGLLFLGQGLVLWRVMRLAGTVHRLRQDLQQLESLFKGLVSQRAK